MNTNTYNKTFSKIYKMLWTDYLYRICPQIQKFYEKKAAFKKNKKILDICCGSGELLNFFLNRGYSAYGIDLSDSMLEHAENLCLKFINNGSLKIFNNEASNFKTPEKFGIVTSTSNSLNEIKGIDNLKGCFKSVYDCLIANGYFIFDMITIKGLKRWNSVKVEEKENLKVIKKGIFDKEKKIARCGISGFIKDNKGLKESFDVKLNYSFYNMAKIKDSLLDIGFRSVKFADDKDLFIEITDPEAKDQIFVIARK